MYSLRFVLSLIGIAAVSFLFGKDNFLIGVGLLSTGIFWLVEADHRFTLPPVRLAFWICVAGSLLGAVYGFVRCLLPFGNENWLFSPMVSSIFCFVAIAITTTVWLSFSVLLMAITGYIQKPRP